MPFPSQSFEVEDKLSSLEQSLESLKVRYEKYFAGVDRIQPLDEHNRYSKKIRTFNSSQLVSTGQKFRFVNLKARYGQLNTLWTKICQQIETGTYIREKALHRLKSVYSTDAIKAGGQSISAPKLPDNESHALEKLYSTLIQSRKDKKLPDKKKFLEMMSKQVDVFKKKNPGHKIQFRLAKDANGSTQIKIEKKK